MLESVGCVARKRRREGAAGKSRIRQMWGEKEIEAPTSTENAFPVRGQDRLSCLKISD